MTVPANFFDKTPQRELVETAGHPYIKLTIKDDDVVTVSAQGIEEQNILPILSLIVKGLARADEPVPAE